MTTYRGPWGVLRSETSPVDPNTSPPTASSLAGLAGETRWFLNDESITAERANEVLNAAMGPDPL